MAELQAPDLRIGNKILRRFWNPQPGNEHYAWDECEVVLIRPDSINIKLRGGAIIGKVPFENVKPMPLTEEWLLKLGCEKVKPRVFKVKWGIDGELFIEKRVNGAICLELGRGFTRVVETVHQFQNAIHALTGQELTA